MDSTRKLIACWAQPRVLRTIAENVRINVLSEFAGVGFAQKVDPIWNEPVSTGSAGALARRSVRSTLNLKLLDAVTVSRFALIAGEDARAPSISLSLSAIPLFGQGRRRQSRNFSWNGAVSSG